MKRMIRNLLALLLCLVLGVLPALAEDGFELAGSVYGVTSAEEVRMGTALVQLVQNAAADGEEIAFYGADEMLAGEEFSAMEALAPAEQALVMLTIMGHTDEIDAAKADLGIEVSEDGQALMDAVTARLSSMAEEDWTEFEGLMEQYFPLVDSDGVMLLQMTLLLSGETSEKVRMSFVENDQSQWLLSQIDTAAA